MLLLDVNGVPGATRRTHVEFRSIENRDIHEDRYGLTIGREL